MKRVFDTKSKIYSVEVEPVQRSSSDRQLVDLQLFVPNQRVDLTEEKWEKVFPVQEDVEKVPDWRHGR